MVFSFINALIFIVAAKSDINATVSDGAPSIGFIRDKLSISIENFGKVEKRVSSTLSITVSQVIKRSASPLTIDVNL